MKKRTFQSQIKKKNEKKTDAMFVEVNKLFKKK